MPPKSSLSSSVVTSGALAKHHHNPPRPPVPCPPSYPLGGPDNDKVQPQMESAYSNLNTT